MRLSVDGALSSTCQLHVFVDELLSCVLVASWRRAGCALNFIGKCMCILGMCIYYDDVLFTFLIVWLSESYSVCMVPPQYLDMCPWLVVACECLYYKLLGRLSLVSDTSKRVDKRYLACYLNAWLSVTYTESYRRLGDVNLLHCLSWKCERRFDVMCLSGAIECIRSSLMSAEAMQNIDGGALYFRVKSAVTRDM